MAGTDKRLKNRELLLLVADAAGGTLDGKTVAQKLLYFCGEELKQPTGHTPYYYGPYSEEFDEALHRSVLAGDMDEKLERIPDWYGRSDALKHIFILTDRGRNEAHEVAQAHREEAEIVARTIDSIKKAVPGFRQKTLSAAAKIHLIVSEQGRPVQLDEVTKLARDLGWNLRQAEVKEAVDVLARLELIEVNA